MFTQKQIEDHIVSSGITAGDTLFIHSSLRSIGQVNGGADAIINAFLEVLGKDGTLCVPTLCQTSGFPREPFDLMTSRSEVGTLTEVFRLRQGAQRSNHPTHSIAALGARAHILTAGHEKVKGALSPWGCDAFGSNSPWDKLYRTGCKYMFVGVDFTVCTMFHYAQTLFLERHQNEYAQIIPFPYFNHIKMGDIIKETGSVRCSFIGDAPTINVPAKIIVDTALDVLGNKPHLVMDSDDPFITWYKKKKNKPLKAGLGKYVLKVNRKHKTNDNTGMYARCVILETPENKIILISLTLLALVKEQCDCIRSAVAKITRTNSENIIITCTHVHSAPQVMGLIEKKYNSINSAVTNAVCKAVKSAEKNLQPARIGYSCCPVDGITRLRRIRMSNGQTYTIRRSVPSTWRIEKKPEFSGVDGILDTQLTVLRIENTHGDPIGCFYNFPCHPIPDFFGYTAELLEKIYSKSFICIPLNGACGNIDTMFDVPVSGKMFDSQLPHLGGILSGNILELMSRIEIQDQTGLLIKNIPVTIPLNSTVTKERKNDPIKWIANAVSRGVFNTSIVKLDIGGMSCIGIPGELASEIGLEIKKIINNSIVCIIGLANDEICYIMPESSWKHGGYETDPKYWGLCDSKAENIIKNAISQNEKVNC